MQTMQMASRVERSFFIVNTSLKIKLKGDLVSRNARELSTALLYQSGA